MRKDRSKKHQIFEKVRAILKVGHLAKAIGHAKAVAFGKMVSLGQNLKMQKNMGRNFTRTIELFCAKNRSEKHQIFEK